MEECQIIRYMQQEDFRGLEALIDSYGFAICQSIWSVLNHPAEASYRKEVENEVFYKIWEKSVLFNPEKASLKTWCLTIAKNLALDKKRQIIRDLRCVPTEFLPEALEWDEPLDKEQFLELVEVLSPEDQLIFLKYFFFQDKPGDISKDLNLSPAVISNRLARGKEKLRRILVKEGKSDEKSV
ncbi:sigma factor [Enterococcus asini]|uniref:sigma factor-like helix-turn-helix DNA-binding protein n=1 Tax=Enterococcus TaxID=1350 RepID=UPI00288E7247|nr:sigma factor-like helix-turn-helix DNA-binding protein [Enterococcus asini]MDT2757191.1 sigma factor [Enterococcus asini]